MWLEFSGGAPATTTSSSEPTNALALLFFSVLRPIFLKGLKQISNMSALDVFWTWPPVTR